MSSQWIKGGLVGLHPAYFALVMATGIVSMGCHLVGWRLLSVVLFALNAVFYVALLGLNLLRIVRHRGEILTDLLHHGRCVGFFTVVAGTCVLGSQCWLIAHWFAGALGLWLLGIAMWIGLTYSLFTIITVKAQKPALAEGINGGWLVSVVAAQAVSVLGAQLAPELGTSAERVLLFCAAMWLGGGMMYLWIISMIFYRYMFFTMSPSDLAPPYWINMGAAAISTLAGTMLVAASDASPVLGQILPFVRGFTLMWWSTATWWIPMLLILGVWRHIWRKFPLRYDPLYWGAVFPLGMYTVCTYRLSQAIAAPFLISVAGVTIYVALGCWLLTMGAMLAHFGTLVRTAMASR